MQNNMKEFVVRQVADSYWIIKMKQEGVPYIQPVETNEFGARIVEYTQSGMTDEEIAEEFNSMFDIGYEEILKDITAFKKQLLESFK